MNTTIKSGISQIKLIEQLAYTRLNQSRIWTRLMPMSPVLATPVTQECSHGNNFNKNHPGIEIFFH